MRRMIENLDEFKRTDGNDEFQVIEGSTSSVSLDAKYVKAGISHNLLTVVFNMKANKKDTLNPDIWLAQIKLPKYVIEHLKGEKISWRLGYQAGITSSKKQILVGLVLDEDAQIIALSNLNELAIDKDEEFRITYSFILQEVFP